MPRHTLLFVGCLLWSALGCTPRPSPSLHAADDAMPPPYQALAEERFGSAFEVTPNADSSYVLVTSQPTATPQNPFPTVGLFVFDMTQTTIIHEDTVTQGRANWTAPYEIEVIITPGTVQAGEAGTRLLGYRFDVRNQRTYPRSATHR